MYQSLKATPRKHRFVFVAFSGEENGLVGSKQYVYRLSGEERGSMRAMVNLQSLGVAMPKARTREKWLGSAFIDAALAVSIKPKVILDDQCITDDTWPFRVALIPVVTIRSDAERLWKIVHTQSDQLFVIDFDAYYASYRVIAAYLAYLDTK